MEILLFPAWLALSAAKHAQSPHIHMRAFTHIDYHRFIVAGFSCYFFMYIYILIMFMNYPFSSEPPIIIYMYIIICT